MAGRRWMTVQNIMEFLQCSKTNAINIMHAFERKGQMIRVGKRLYVTQANFENWCNELERQAEFSKWSVGG